VRRGRAITGLKRTGLIVALLAALLCVGLFSANSDYRSFQRELTGYLGLQIGASMEETRYVFDEPTSVLEQPKYDKNFKDYLQLTLTVKGQDPKLTMPTNKSIMDYFGWAFDDQNRRIDVTFDSKTRLVTASAATACPALFGIKPLMTEDEVRRTIGREDRSKFTGISKDLRYDRLGLDIYLTKKRVYYIKKNAPSGSPLFAYFQKWF
jgi:hypothetical protein